MSIRPLTFVLAALLVGCKAIEGTYEPGCIAYEGDRITLSGGRFEWGKFTDQVVLDDDGNIVNQFPGYPKSGSYRIDSETLHLSSGDVLHLRSHEGRYVLLTDAQFATQESTGEIDACALVRAAD